MIAIGSDHAGFQLKSLVADILRAAGIAVEDLGTGDASSVDYPDFAHRVAAAVAGGTAERGVLICGTGIGMSMAANRHPGVRTARIRVTVA